MRIPNTLRWGLALAATSAVISGISIYLNGVFIHDFPTPTVLAAVRNSLVGIVLVGLLLGGRAARAEVRRLSRRQWTWLLVIGIVGGAVPFALFFNGLALAASPTAAFIQKTLFVWVAVLAVPLLGERLGWTQIAALGALFAGSGLLGAPGGVRLGTGELMIVAATSLWAIEVILAKRLLAGMGSNVLAAGRMAIGGGLLFAFVLAGGYGGAMGGISQSGWLEIGLTSLLLIGYVVTWFAALKRAPATVVTSILVAGAVITGVLNALFAGGAPTPVAFGAWVLIVAGGVALAVRALVSRGRPAPAVAG